MKYYIYTYTDPINQNVFYVGKGQKDRAESHLRRRMLKLKLHNDDFAKRIDEILEANMKPIIEIKEYFDDEKKACDFESALIQEIGIENLTNKQIFSWPFKLTPEVLHKRAESCKKNEKWRATIQSKEHREKLSKAVKLGIANKGGRQPLSPEHRQAVSKGLKGKLQGEKNPNCKNTPEQIYSYLEAVMNGANWRNTAKEFGIKNAWKVLQRKDWQHVNAPPGYEPPSRKCVDESDVQTTLRMFEEGRSIQEIADAIGFTKTTVRNILKVNKQ